LALQHKKLIVEIGASKGPQVMDRGKLNAGLRATVAKGKGKGRDVSTRGNLGAIAER